MASINFENGDGIFLGTIGGGPDYYVRLYLDLEAVQKIEEGEEDIYPFITGSDDRMMKGCSGMILEIPNDMYGTNYHKTLSDALLEGKE